MSKQTTPTQRFYVTPVEKKMPALLPTMYTRMPHTPGGETWGIDSSIHT